MSITATNVISLFNASLAKAGYAGIGTPEPSATAFKDLLDQSTEKGTAAASAAKQDFFSHPMLGKDANGAPVVGPTAEECAKAIDNLTQQALARGQDPDTLRFVLGKMPVSDGLAGPVIGFQMCPLVLLEGLKPIDSLPAGQAGRLPGDHGNPQAVRRAS